MAGDIMDPLQSTDYLLSGCHWRSLT